MTSPHAAAAGVPPIDLDAAPAPSLVTRPDPAAADAPDAAPSRAPWPLWQRLAFRFGVVYFALYTFVPDEWDSSWWSPVTDWMSSHGLAPYEVIHQRTGSGDTAHDFAKMIAIAAFAAVGMLVWSLIQRRSGHPVLWKWVHAVVRFELAVQVLGYGLAKFYGGQFGQLGIERLMTPVGDLAPMRMVGTFMQASKPYELFGGGGEVLAALLLFHRRTAALGAIVATAVMTNVAALNWLCGVPVKLYSTHLLLFAFAVLLPFLPSLWALLVRHRQAQPVDLHIARGARARRVVSLLGWGLVAWWLVTSHVERKEFLAQWQERTAMGPHYGCWQVETMVLDGVEIPRNDPRRWRHLAIERGSYAWCEETSGMRHGFDITLDATGAQAQVAERRREPGPKETWTFEAGTKTTKVRRDLLLRNEDRYRLVDGERRTLLVRGTWQGKPIELHTIEKRFLLQTGFQLRQELPEFW